MLDSQKSFLINQSSEKIQDVALLSLKLSIKAYFTTYKGIQYDLRKYVLNVHPQDTEVKNLNWPYPKGYIENAYEAINHFHHFVELVIKEVLRQKNEKLAFEYDEKKFEITNAILKGKLTNEQENQINESRTVKFEIAFKRLKKLIKVSNENSFQYDFLVKASYWLCCINKSRNAILHRGIEIYHYKYLDELFCKNVFPLVLKILKLDIFENLVYWKFNQIQSNIDLINSIIECGNTREYKDRVDKLALLKEIGRAAYENQLCYTKNENLFKKLNEQTIHSVNAIIESLNTTDNIHTILECPVCGLNSLVQFVDTQEVTQDEASETIYEEYVYQVHCFNCTFHLPCGDPEIIDKMGLPIQNFWKTKENRIDTNNKEFKGRMKKYFENLK